MLPPRRLRGGFGGFQCSGSGGGVLRPAATAPPGNPLAIQILRPQPGATGSAALGVGPSSLSGSRPSTFFFSHWATLFYLVS